jgi:hypothetical protein
VRLRNGAHDDETKLVAAPMNRERPGSV